MPDKKTQRLLDAVKSGKIVDEKTLALHQILDDAQELVDRAEGIKNDIETKAQQTKEELAKEIMPSEEDLQKLIQPLIPEIPKTVKGDKGDKGDSIVGPPGPKGDTVIGPPGPPGESITGPAGLDADEEAVIAKIEEDLPKLGEKIRDGLASLEGDARLDISAIKGLPEQLKTISDAANKPISMASIAGRDIIKDIDISTQFNGVLKTFSLSAIWNIISVNLSSYPYGSLRKNIDYTYTPTSITFTSTIDATTQLSAGQQCVLTVVQS